MRYPLLALTLTIFLFSCHSFTDSLGHKNTDQSQSNAVNKLSQQVIIRRTQHGVVHIQADNFEAAGFALGYAQMEDHAPRVIELLLKARGQWAKYTAFAPDELDKAVDDDAANLLEYQRAVETFDLLETDTQAFISGFSQGINRYIALFPEEFAQWPELLFTVYDVHARNIVSPSNASIRNFLEARDADKQNLNIIAKRALRELEQHADVGSNVWAFSEERSKSGHAILMRNPHLNWNAGYYEAHIKVADKLNFYGDFRVGQAIGIIGGFNQYLGWSTTNNSPDLDDIYAFKVDPNKPNHYLLDGQSMPLDKRVVEVIVKTQEGFDVEKRAFWSSAHGPVILRDKGLIYIIKSAGNGEFRTGEQFFKMMQATNLQSWKNAMKIRARISSNLTYADAQGNIFYVWNATMPKRPHAPLSNEEALEVSRSEQMWQSITPWDALPQLENPKGGYLRNENDTFHFTNLNEVLEPEQFPAYFPEPQLRLRSQHSIELIYNQQKFSLEEVLALKHSERMLMADRVKDDLIAALEESELTPEMTRALALMKSWDNSVAIDSKGAVLFKTWWQRYVDSAEENEVKSTPASVGYAATAERLFAQPWSYQQPTTTPYGLADPARAVAAFMWAIDEAKAQYGAWDLAWGEVHRARVADMDLPVGGCTGLLGCYRVMWFTEHESNPKQRQVRGGDGWIFAVEFGEVPRAYSVLAYGQSSKSGAVHTSDQLLDFTQNIMTPVSFTEADINENMISEYRPGASELAAN